MWSLWFMACSPDPTLEGSCQLASDNALRATCGFSVDPPSPLDLTLTPEGEGKSIALSSSEAATHDLPLWRMLPETRYRWVARVDEVELAGELTTGALPAPARLAVQRTGQDPGGDTMFVASCEEPVAIVLDPQGRVVWYQELAAGLPPEQPHGSNSLTFTEDGTAMAILDRQLVREFALDGTLLAEHPYGDGSTLVLHHDAFRRDGRTYALTARLQERDGVEYIVDGVVAFETDGSVLFDWDLSQLATPDQGGIGAIYWSGLWPGALDWTHANGLYVDEDGDVILSLHTFSTVLRLEGDPADPAFGTPVWALQGASAGSPFGSDFVIIDPEGLTGDDSFGHQHHPSLLPDGTLQIFDNGEDVTDEARVLRLALDPASGEAAVRGSWPIGAVCPIEGGAFVRTGHDGQDTVVATCALRGRFYEISPGDGAILGATELNCRGTQGFDVLPRAIPVELPSPGAAP